MGEIDIRAHELLRDSEEFSRLFNMVLFGGQDIVRSELLQDANAVVALSDDNKGLGEKGGKKACGKGSLSIRDLLRKVQIMKDGCKTYMLLGVENQASIDYGMVPRLLNYNVRNHILEGLDGGHKGKKGDARPFTSKMGPGDRLTPVVSVVVYYGDKPWDGATELSEMFFALPKEIEEAIKPFLPSYKIKVISAQCTDSELDMLGPGLRSVLYYVRYAHDASGLQEMLEKHPDLRTPPPLAARLISCLMGIEFNFEEKKENLDMWTVVEQLKEMGRAEGRAEGRVEGRVEGRAEGRVEGRAEGRVEGRAEGMTEVICSMYQNGLKISEISKSTNISQSRLRRMVAKKKAKKV